MIFKLVIFWLFISSDSVLSSGPSNDSSSSNEIEDYPYRRKPSRADDQGQQEQQQQQGDSGCVTPDGRPGSCVVRAACRKDNSNLLVCYKVPGLFGSQVEFVCCPDSGSPGVTPRPIPGGNHIFLVSVLQMIIFQKK